MQKKCEKGVGVKDENNLLKLYVYNYNVAGDVAFIELKNWKVVPGSAYSKRH